VLLVVELVSRCGYLSGKEMLQRGEMSPWRETFAGSHNWPLSQTVHFVLRRPGDLQRWARLVSGLDAKCSARVALELRYVATDETVPTLARLGNVVQQLQWTVGREVSDQLTDVGLRGLAGLASLQSLNLSYCRAITNAGLEYVSRLGSLQSLHLSYCRAITKAGAARLQAAVAARGSAFGAIPGRA
jgi:hypothetical protein